MEEIPQGVADDLMTLHSELEALKPPTPGSANKADRRKRPSLGVVKGMNLTQATFDLHALGDRSGAAALCAAAAAGDTAEVARLLDNLAAAAAACGVVLAGPPCENKMSSRGNGDFNGVGGSDGGDGGDGIWEDGDDEDGVVPRSGGDGGRASDDEVRDERARAPSVETDESVSSPFQRHITDAICAAASEGSAECVRLLGKRSDGTSVVHQVDEHGRTPAFYAATEGHAECLLALAEAGFDLRDPVDTEGNTAAFHAASDGHSACLRSLGCFVDLGKPCDRIGNCPAYYAATERHVECLRAIAEVSSLLFLLLFCVRA